MTINIEDYNLISKRQFDKILLLIFQNVSDKNDKKILELINIIGFIEDIQNKNALKFIRIDTTGGSYIHDLSLKLKKPEINSFQEVYIFTDSKCINFCFRAAAQNINFRDWSKTDF